MRHLKVTKNLPASIAGVPSAGVADLWLLSLNRFIYLMNRVKAGNDGSMAMKILNRIEFEGAAKFALFEREEDAQESWISIANEADKLVWAIII